MSLARSIASFLGVGLLMLVFDKIVPRHRRAARMTRLLTMARPLPVTDDAVDALVRKTIARVASRPEAIQVDVEHGCVELRGPVETEERARIVKAIADAKGVDSIVDLMTEPASATASNRDRSRARLPATHVP